MKERTQKAIEMALKFKGGRSRPDKSFPLMKAHLDSLGEDLRVLDVGCGRGSFGYILRAEYHDKFSIDGVDVHAQYMSEIRGPRSPYRSVFHTNFLVSYPNFTDYDVYLFVDVLEHFPRQNAVEIVEFFKGKRIIASIPNDEKHWHQDPGFEKDNPHEAHLHDWTNAEVEEALGLRLVGENDAIGVFANW